MIKQIFKQAEAVLLDNGELYCFYKSKGEIFFNRLSPDQENEFAEVYSWNEFSDIPDEDQYGHLILRKEIDGRREVVVYKSSYSLWEITLLEQTVLLTPVYERGREVYYALGDSEVYSIPKAEPLNSDLPNLLIPSYFWEPKGKYLQTGDKGGSVHYFMVVDGVFQAIDKSQLPAGEYIPFGHQKAKQLGLSAEEIEKLEEIV